MSSETEIPQADLGTLAIRVSMLPRDTNPGGTIFGGVILSQLDQAGGIEFIAPVFTGDLVSFYTRTLKLGRTSVTVGLIVEAARYRDRDCVVRVMEAEAVYVAVDEKTRKPIPIKDE
jgi:acyl-CoA thioesterase YciA